MVFTRFSTETAGDDRERANTSTFLTACWLFPLDWSSHRGMPLYRLEFGSNSDSMRIRADNFMYRALQKIFYQPIATSERESRANLESYPRGYTTDASVDK